MKNKKENTELKSNRKIIITLLLIVLLMVTGFFAYNFIRGYGKVKIPIYSYKCDTHKLKRCHTNKLDYFVQQKKPKVSRNVICKYDDCKWVYYGNSTMYNYDWLMYDNNNANDGGYYFYDHINNRRRNNVFASVSVIHTCDTETAFRGLTVTDKNEKYGVYNIRNNKLVIDTDNYDIKGFCNDLLAIKHTEASKYAIYTMGGKKLTDEIYDDVSYVSRSDIWNHALIVKKDGKYNAFYYDSLTKIDDKVLGKYERLFVNDFDYLDFIYYDKDFGGQYFIYVKDGKLSLSIIYLNTSKIIDDYDYLSNTPKIYDVDNINDMYSIILNSENAMEEVLNGIYSFETDGDHISKLSYVSNNPDDDLKTYTIDTSTNEVEVSIIKRRY